MEIDTPNVCVHTATPPQYSHALEQVLQGCSRPPPPPPRPPATAPRAAPRCELARVRVNARVRARACARGERRKGRGGRTSTRTGVRACVRTYARVRAETEGRKPGNRVLAVNQSSPTSFVPHQQQNGARRLRSPSYGERRKGRGGRTSTRTGVRACVRTYARVRAETEGRKPGNRVLAVNQSSPTSFVPHQQQNGARRQREESQGTGWKERNLAEGLMHAGALARCFKLNGINDMPFTIPLSGLMASGMVNGRSAQIVGW